MELFLYFSKTPFWFDWRCFFYALRQSIVCKYYLWKKVLLYLSTVYMNIYFLLARLMGTYFT